MRYQTALHLEKNSLEKLEAFGSGIGIRTPTNRVRVCRATVTQFGIAVYSIPPVFCFVNSFFQFFKSFEKENFPEKRSRSLQGRIFVVKYSYTNGVCGVSMPPKRIFLCTEGNFRAGIFFGFCRWVCRGNRRIRRFLGGVFGSVVHFLV